MPSRSTLGLLFAVACGGAPSVSDGPDDSNGSGGAPATGGTSSGGTSSGGTASGGTSSGGSANTGGTAGDDGLGEGGGGVDLGGAASGGSPSTGGSASGGGTSTGGAASVSGTCPEVELTWAKLALGSNTATTMHVYDVAVLEDPTHGSVLLVVGELRRGGNVTFGTGTPREKTVLVGGGSPFWAKYDLDGEFLDVGIFHSGGGAARGVTVNGDGSFFVAGDFQNSIRFEYQTPNERLLTTVYNDFDVFLARVAPNGTVDWVLQGADPDSTRIVRLAKKPNGNSVLLVRGSGATFAAGTEHELTTLDGHQLIEVSPRGVPLAGTSFTVSDAIDLLALSDGSVAVSGSYRANATFNGSPSVVLTGEALDDSLFVARYDGELALDWVYSLRDFSTGAHLLPSDDGRILFSGRAEPDAIFDPGGPLETSLPTNSAFFGELTPRGSFHGVVRTGRGPGAALETDLIETRNGSRVSIGYLTYQRIFGPNDDLTVSGSRSISYVQCTARDGSLGWVDQIVGVQAGYLRAATLLPNGDLFVAGSMNDDTTVSFGTPQAVTLTRNLTANNVLFARYRLTDAE